VKSNRCVFRDDYLTFLYTSIAAVCFNIERKIARIFAINRRSVLGFGQREHASARFEMGYALLAVVVYKYGRIS